MIYILAMVAGAFIMLIGVLAGAVATDVVSKTTLQARMEVENERPGE